MKTKTYSELTKAEKEEIMITVCASCNTAACWWYIFLCDEFQTANLYDVPICYLEQFGAEHSDYWKNGIEAHFKNKEINKKKQAENGKKTR